MLFEQIPDGCCKFYSSTVIEEILQNCAGKTTFSCAYFFFDNRNGQADLSKHEKMLRSIICQLSQQSTGIPPPLMETYGGGHQQPSVASLQLTLERIVEGFEHVYIVLDALDECTDRQKLLAWIDDIFRRKCGNVHILLSSRLEADIEERFGCLDSLSRVSLAGSSADTDIATYLDAMLSKMVRWDAQTRVRVRSVLLDGADGM